MTHQSIPTPATGPFKLLLTGLTPTSPIDPYWRNLYGTPEEIDTKVRLDAQRLRDANHDVKLYYVSDQEGKVETAIHELEELLKKGGWDGISIGSGLRLVPEQTVLFERVVNLVRELAPGAVWVFNSGPGTTYDAIVRNQERLTAVRDAKSA